MSTVPTVEDAHAARTSVAPLQQTKSLSRSRSLSGAGKIISSQSVSLFLFIKDIGMKLLRSCPSQIANLTLATVVRFMNLPESVGSVDAVGEPTKHKQRNNFEEACLRTTARHNAGDQNPRQLAWRGLMEVGGSNDTGFASPLPTLLWAKRRDRVTTQRLNKIGPVWLLTIREFCFTRDHCSVPQSLFALIFSILTFRHETVAETEEVWEPWWEVDFEDDHSVA